MTTSDGPPRDSWADLLAEPPAVQRARVGGLVVTGLQPADPQRIIDANERETLGRENARLAAEIRELRDLLREYRSRAAVADPHFRPATEAQR